MSDALARRPMASVISEPGEPFIRNVIWAAARVLRVLTKQRWYHPEKIPRTGGVLFVVNHISNADPLAYGHFLTWSGRWPRFMAKDAIFKVPVLGWIASHCGQIMVRRGTDQAHLAVTAAIEAIAAGRGVSVYPEGTITADPLTWPMTAKSGAARIALTADCPVIPVGQWGANEILPGKKLTWPRIFPRKTMLVMAGDPVDLDDLRRRPMTPEAVLEASRRIMDAVTALVAVLRGETPPEKRWDLALGNRVDDRPRGPR